MKKKTVRPLRRATIDDVAKLAKTSIKTVSRVVNNEPNVSTATRARVTRAVSALDYRPSPSARNLAARRSFLIGLLYDNPSASYVTGVLAGVLAACQRRKYQLLMHPCGYDRPGLVDEVNELIRRSHVEGFILTPPLSDQRALLHALDASGTDYVRVAPGRRIAPGRGVYTNDREVCMRMTEHLASLGHGRIGFIIGHPDHAAVAARYRGYLDGLASSGIDFDADLVAQGLNSFESGVESARKLLGLRNRPTAIFAANDDMAAGALFVAHELGIVVPDQLSIAGFDDIPLARQVWPSLTTIRQPIFEMAQQAAELLLARLRGHPILDAGSETIESIIVLRNSTAAVAGSSQGRQSQGRRVSA